ncbi:protein AF-9 [Daktulosphaira vitifoliae]|uniref:protein AF-9 n=1 Tax=Daktulosphaira vitifoliae TaxID=58002 RepID=UPI0021AAB229|nr:protein AF-9 [Daktulosphaira vitifoliae]
MNMAFPYVKVIFEIGHEASVRNKRTPEGFTHDWELFVRGADNTDIHYFVDKVVFNLHDTFPNPKRVVKEPPYVVKESGYAGFPLPIDIYVRNKDEPRKIRFNYELILNERGSPPIFKVIREKYIFSPSEDFRRKLIKGGGISVLSHDGTEIKNSSNSAVSKSKSSTNISRLPSPPPKKHKKEDMKLNNTFATLFGSPIQPSKLPLTTSKSTSQKSSTSSEKSQQKLKSSPHHKEEKKDKEKDKEKKKSKELSVDKVKKDKDKKEKEKSKDSSEKSKSLKISSSKTEKKESTHHEKVKEKNNDTKIDKKDLKDKVKRDDKIKEKIKEKSHKDEKSYHESKIISKQDVKLDYSEEKKKHKSSPDSLKVKSDKKIEKVEKLSKPHKSHKEHKKKDKRDKEEKEKKKEEKTVFNEQESFKHAEILNQQNSSLDDFTKTKEEHPENSPLKANSSRIHDSDTEEGFLSEDSESYQQPELPKSKDLHKKKLSPENSFIKKKKRKKKEREIEEPRPKLSRTEIPDEMRETCSDISRSPSPSPSNNKFTDEYINSLKNLQHKIMMLEDEDLQRVVTVIAETGHYEITTKTFDFDLCALNETTVKKLQELIT